MKTYDKITTQVGREYVQIVKLQDTFEVAVLRSRQPSKFARTLQEALEIMNGMVTALQWMREMEAK